jgi:ABC-2 type transport system permease protein
LTWLGLEIVGSVWLLLVIAVLDALLGMALGLFASAFARTEFQAVQFMPAIVMPQVLLCGLFVPRDEMATVLDWISDALPLSYAVDALTQVTTSSEVDGTLIRNLLVIAGCALVALLLGAATLRRRTP